MNGAAAITKHTPSGSTPTAGCSAICMRSASSVSNVAVASSEKRSRIDSLASGSNPRQVRVSRPITSKLLYAALINAETGTLTEVFEMPWYAKVLLLSQPLHFGDYGGLPLKIIWALLDLITIVVLGSGLYLWWGKWKMSDGDPAAIASPVSGS